MPVSKILSECMHAQGQWGVEVEAAFLPGCKVSKAQAAIQTSFPQTLTNKIIFIFHMVIFTHMYHCILSHIMLAPNEDGLLVLLSRPLTQ